MAATVYSRTLRRAAELMGGRKKLARYLRAPLSELEKWIADEAMPPTGIFLKAVDYLLDETVPPQGGSEPGEPPPSQELSPGDDSSTAY
jgi:hypothetical protein